MEDFQRNVAPVTLAPAPLEAKIDVLVDRMCAAIPEEWPSIQTRLVEIGPPAAARLRSRLFGHPDALAQARMLDTLARIPVPETLELFAGILKDGDVTLRLAAVRSLWEGAPAPLFELALADKDAVVRAAAFERLVELHDPAWKDAAVKALDYPHPAVRLEALRYLREIGMPGIPKVVERMLADPDPGVRKAALAAYHEMLPKPIAFPALRARVLEEQNPQVLEHVYEVLRGIDIPEAAEAFAERLQDPDVRVRRLAAGFLTVAHRCPAAAPALGVALMDLDPEVRLLAAAALATHATPEVVPAIRATIGSSEESRALVQALFKAGGPAAVDAVADTMSAELAASGGIPWHLGSDSDMKLFFDWLREHATPANLPALDLLFQAMVLRAHDGQVGLAERIADLSGSADFERVARLFDAVLERDDYRSPLKSLGSALVRVDPARGSTFLLDRMERLTGEVARHLAYGILCQEGVPITETQLMALLDPERKVELRGIGVSMACGVKSLSPEARTRLVTRALQDPSAEVRVRAIESAGCGEVFLDTGFLLGLIEVEGVVWPEKMSSNQIGVDSIVRRLRRLESERWLDLVRGVIGNAKVDGAIRSKLLEDWVLPKLGREAIPDLIRYLVSDSPEVRKAAAQAAGQLVAEEAADALIERLRDPSHEVRQAASASLAAIRAFREEIEHWQAWRSGRAEHADPAVAELLAMLESKEAATRAAAAEGLGQLGAREAVPALVKRYLDSDPAVQRAARQAVDRIGEAGRAAPPAAAPEDGNRRGPSLKELREELALAESRLAGLLATRSDTHPLVVEQRARIAALKKVIENSTVEEK